MDERTSVDGGKDLILSVTKKGQPFLQELLFYHGTSLDGSFLRTYPHREWVSDWILRFGNGPGTDQGDDLTEFDRIQ